MAKALGGQRVTPPARTAYLHALLLKLKCSCAVSARRPWICAPRSTYAVVVPWAVGRGRERQSKAFGANVWLSPRPRRRGESEERAGKRSSETRRKRRDSIGKTCLPIARNACSQNWCHLFLIYMYNPALFGLAESISATPCRVRGTTQPGHCIEHHCMARCRVKTVSLGREAVCLEEGPSMISSLSTSVCAERSSRGCIILLHGSPSNINALMARID